MGDTVQEEQGNRKEDMATGVEKHSDSHVTNSTRDGHRQKTQARSEESPWVPHLNRGCKSAERIPNQAQQRQHLRAFQLQGPCRREVGLDVRLFHAVLPKHRDHHCRFLVCIVAFFKACTQDPRNCKTKNCGQEEDRIRLVTKATSSSFEKG